jgi:hypothetical protein
MFFSFNSCFIHLLLNSSSAQKIHNVLLRKGYKTPGIYKIKKWLQNQDDYSLQRPIRRQFKRARVVVSSFDEQLDVFTLSLYFANDCISNRSTSSCSSKEETTTLALLNWRRMGR